MLTFIYNEKEQPIDIQYSPTEYDLKSFSDFERVTNAYKPVHVIKHFLSQYIKSELYKPYIEIETQYADLLRNNKKTETDENGNEIITDIIDTENITDEIKELEDEYPYLKRFRETQVYPLPENLNNEEIPEDEKAPKFTDEDVKNYEPSNDIKSLMREYNAKKYEDNSKSFIPDGYNFPMWIKTDDLVRLKTTIDLAGLSGKSDSDIITVSLPDKTTKDLTISQVKDLLRKAFVQNQSKLKEKWQRRHGFLNSNSIDDILSNLDQF